MESILLVTVTSILTILAYTTGLKNAQRIDNNQPIELPKIEPIKAIKQAIDNREKETEMKNFETILENIENYDGTSKNQREVK